MSKRQPGTGDSKILSDLQTFGFASVDYPVWLTGLVTSLMRSWKKFCELPTNTKSLFTYSGDMGSGYEFKNEAGEGRDRKENFHFTIEDMTRHFEIMVENNINSDLVSNAQAILCSIRSPILKFAETLGQELNLPGLDTEAYMSWQKWFLRCLHYFGGRIPEEVIASHHADKAGFTAYLGESCTGVQYLDWNKEWKDMPVRPGKMIITPNMQLQYKTKGKLTALYHRVVATEESKVAGRDSIVCFIPFLHTPQYNKERYGRMQDLPLGFNYGLSRRKFAKYFV